MKGEGIVETRRRERMAKITKAVVAVAGSGTRFLPVTKTIPKEMLPIVDKPIIHFVVEELVEAGIKDIIMVTRWDKKPLEDYFDNHPALNHNVGGEGARNRLKSLSDIAEKVNFVYLRQKGALWERDAGAHGRHPGRD